MAGGMRKKKYNQDLDITVIIYVILILTGVGFTSGNDVPWKWFFAGFGLLNLFFMPIIIILITNKK